LTIARHHFAKSMQKRNVLNSSRLLKLKKHRQKTAINKILLFLFGLVVIFIVSIYISRLNALNINNIEVTGNQIVDTNAIKNIVKQQISGKYFFFFPKTNIFFYPENNIKNALQDKFKILEDINLSVKNNHTLEISLSERKGTYIWCGSTPPTSPDVEPQNVSGDSTSGDCYFIDESGYIFDQAPYFSGEIYFKFYGVPEVQRLETSGGSTSGDLSTAGDFDPSGLYFARQNFSQLISFKDILVSFGLKPVSMYITTDGNVEVFLSSANSSTVGPDIIFKLNSDYQNVAENLEAALTTDPLQTEFKNNYSLLQYIDLRFSNKVYYKFSAPGISTQ
jgi:hypothetical protein